MRRCERASALVLALLMLVIAQALVLAVTTRAIAASHAARRIEDRAIALNACEAALADAVQRLLRDNLATRGEGRLGMAAWEVDADERGVEPYLWVATFDARARCRQQSRHVRLRVVVRREELHAVSDLWVLDWTPEPASP
jgi:Tfp pilus assembly protein PilX